MNQPASNTSRLSHDSQITELDLPLSELADDEPRAAISQRPRAAAPPPPPMAAYSQRAPKALPAPVGQELAIPVAPPALAEGWSELAPNPSFVALSQAPRAQARNWPQIVSVGAGAFVLLASGYIAGITRWDSTPTLTPVSQTEHIVAKPLTVAARPGLAVAEQELAAHSAEALQAKPLTAATLLTSTAPSGQLTAIDHASNTVADKVVSQPSALATDHGAALQNHVAPSEPAQVSVTTSVAPQVPEAQPAAASETIGSDTASAEAVVQTADQIAPPTAALPEADLPELPTREAVKDSLEGVRAQLAACAGTAHGTSFANVTISGSGRASYSTIEGAFAGTTQGSCMARTLRTAAFPKFTAASFKVRYPFVF